MASKRHSLYFAGAGALVAVVISVVAADAFGHGASASTTPVGEKLFTSSGCSGCHTFKAARAKGKLGPNLDKVNLTVAKITLQLTKGGSVLIGKAAAAKYKAQMISFKGRLSTKQIAEIASFVHAYRNHAPIAGASSGGSPVGSTTPTTTPTSTTGGGGGGTAVTTTTPAGGAGGTDTLDNCPAGKTIPTSGNTDADDDDTLGQAQTDGDGCV